MAINLEQKLREIAKPEPKKGANDGKGKPYWSIEQFRGRMDEVFGPSGYSMEYTMMPPYEFPVMKQVLLTCHCKINIYDEGRIVYSTMGIGCKEMKRQSKTYKEYNHQKKCQEEKTRDDSEREYIELNNAAYNLQLSAFKNACKSLNIFGCNSEDDEGDSGYSNSGYSNSGYSNSQGKSSTNGSNSKTSSKGNGANSSNCELIHFYVTTSLNKTGEDRDMKKPIYEATAYKMVSDEHYDDSESFTIVFYPNQYMTHVDRFTEMYKMKEPYEQKMLVKKGSRGGYVFCGFGG